jgi:hypothetical protein
MVEDKDKLPVYHRDPFKCPVCKVEMNAATPTGEDKGEPRNGDICLCIYCGSALVYAKEGPRKITDEELADMALNNREGFSFLIRAQNEIAMLRFDIENQRRHPKSTK